MRKARPWGRKPGKKIVDVTAGLEVLRPHAAGIDVGNAEHYVAVPCGRDAQPVREFGSFTADLHRMARSLEGNWREELLFVLQQSLQMYDIYLEKIAVCDQRIEAHLKTM